MIVGLRNLFEKRVLVAIFLLSFVLSFLIFGNGISGDFVFDDVAVVQNRPDLKDGDNFLDLFVSPYHQSTPKTGLYRPFTMASYAMNHYVNDSPIGFHIINIIIHALNSFLVFWLVSYLFKNRFLSFSVFLLFLTHPIHTEAVTSIVGRAELWAFFWGLVTICFFIKKNTPLSLVSFLFALLSKEVALMVLPVIFYIDWALIKNWLFLTAKRVLFFALPLGIYSVLRYLALGGYFLGDSATTVVANPLKFASFAERITTAFKVLYLYIEKLIWPVQLSADYSYNTILPVENLSEPTFLTGTGFFGLLLFLLLYRKTHKTALALGSLLFLAPYLIVSNLITPIGTIMGERLMYFPSFGFLLLFSYLLFKLSEKAGKKPAYVVLLLIVVFFSARTIVRNNDWNDAKTLFYATVKVSPNSLITRAALAAVYIKTDEWDEAKGQLNIARSIHENNSRVQNLLGIVADHDGDYGLAEEKYLRSLELNPDAVNAQINLAELYAKQGRLEEAGAMFKKVIDFYPVDEYVIRYVYIQITLHDPDGAIDAINKYLGDDLDNPDLNAPLGTAYFVKGDYKQATLFLKQAQNLGHTAPEIGEMIQISEGKVDL